MEAGAENLRAGENGEGVWNTDFQVPQGLNSQQLCFPAGGRAAQTLSTTSHREGRDPQD